MNFQRFLALNNMNLDVDLVNLSVLHLNIKKNSIDWQTKAISSNVANISTINRQNIN